MVFLLLRAIIITIIAQPYPPTRHTNGYLLESSGLPLPGTYTTTISGQCSARGNCPLTAHLRWGRTKNTPCIFSKYTKGKDLFKQKKFNIKWAKFSAALFHYLLFKNRLTLKHKTPAYKQPEFCVYFGFYICSRASFFCSQNIRSVKKTAEKNKPISRLCQYAAGPCSITKSRKQPKGRQTTQ